MAVSEPVASRALVEGPIIEDQACLFNWWPGGPTGHILFLRSSDVTITRISTI